MATKVAKKRTGKIISEQNYSLSPTYVNSLSELTFKQLRAQNVSWLIVSSFNYDRFLFGLTLKGQDKSTYKRGRFYRILFNKCRYQRVIPTYHSFAFSNPEIRLVNIKSCRFTRQKKRAS